MFEVGDRVIVHTWSERTQKRHRVSPGVIIKRSWENASWVRLDIEDGIKVIARHENLTLEGGAG